jgi:hypothetical protein
MRPGELADYGLSDIAIHTVGTDNDVGFLTAAIQLDSPLRFLQRDMPDFFLNELCPRFLGHPQQVPV